MEDWIEIEKKPARSQLAVGADEVAVGLKLIGATARRSRSLRINIGEAVSEKLGWEAGFKVRIEWSTATDRIKISEPPPDHPNSYELKAGKRHLRIAVSAIPPSIPHDVASPMTVVRHEAYAPSTRSTGGFLIAALPAQFKARKAA